MMFLPEVGEHYISKKRPDEIVKVIKITIDEFVHILSKNGTKDIIRLNTFLNKYKRLTKREKK